MDGCFNGSQSLDSIDLEEMMFSEGVESNYKSYSNYTPHKNDLSLLRNPENSPNKCSPVIGELEQDNVDANDCCLNEEDISKTREPYFRLKLF